MNWIKNKLIDPLNNRIDVYNPIHDVCHFLGESYLVLSSNFDQMTNGGDVTLGRRMMYQATFAIHLLVMIKYAILAIYDDIYTIAMFGESFHVFNNIYICSHLCLSVQMAIVPIKFTVLSLDDKFVANMLLTISRFQTSFPLIRIDNRKVNAKIWLMSKLFNKFMLPLKWFVIPTAMIYCSTLAYTISPIPVNLVTLAFNSIIQWVWLINLIEIGFCGGICFFLTISMALLRYKEIIHLVKCNNVAGLTNVSHLYNQLVIDIKMCRRLFDPLIGILYLTLPFTIGFLCQLILIDNFLARLQAVIGLLVACGANYTIYYMVSSICPMNKIILKLLIPIQFDKRHKTRQMKLKIDSFIARLSKEFVGFYCLYAIKFTRKTFYQYILGISMTYLLVDGFVDTNQ